MLNSFAYVADLLEAFLVTWLECRWEEERSAAESASAALSEKEVQSGVVWWKDDVYRHFPDSTIKGEREYMLLLASRHPVTHRGSSWENAAPTTRWDLSTLLSYLLLVSHTEPMEFWHIIKLVESSM